MANKIDIKHSNVAGVVPTTSSINLNEIAFNVVDGKAYFKRDGNNPSIAEFIATPHSGSFILSGSQTIAGYMQFMPVVTNINQSLSASYIYVSGSTNDLYFTQNGQGYANTTRLRWIEGNLYTGIFNGGLITTQSSTVYQVQSGSGIIVNLNASIGNNPYPTVQYINWPTLSSSIAPLSASYDQQFIAINNAGQIFAQGIPYSDGDYNTKMPIGIVIHQNRSTINAVQTFPSVAYGWKQRSFDFIKAFGPLKISGYTLQTSSSLGLLLDGGTAWVDGRNYIVDPNNPSYITEAVGIATSKIYYYYQSGSSFKYDTNGGVGYTSITSSLYSNNGVLTPLGASSRWSIQRVFYFPNSATKAFYIYYGNAEYQNKTEAIAAIQTEAFSEAPNTAANAIFIGYLLLEKVADFGNTNTYEFRAAGLFRGGGSGGSGGGGGGGATTLAGLTDVQITSPTNGQPLVYSTSATKWINSSALTASIQGTASYATSASYASRATTIFPYTGSAIITGSLGVTGSIEVFSTNSVTDTLLTVKGRNGTNSGSIQINPQEIIFNNSAERGGDYLILSFKDLTYPAGNSVLHFPAGQLDATLPLFVNGEAADGYGTITLTTIPTASYVNPLNQAVIVTGSLFIKGSSELAATMIGGLIIGDASNFTGGEKSFVQGINTSTDSFGHYAHAEGGGTTAAAYAAHAEGSGSLAAGNYSHAEGNTTETNGIYSHTEGDNTYTYGAASHAEGLSTKTIGDYSHAEGRLTETSGSYSHAEGHSTITSGSYSHAEGQSTITRGNYSHAEGLSTITRGNYSHAEGGGAITSGSFSHAEGNSTITSGSYSHAEGYYTIARGSNSHAEGWSTIARGFASHAEGNFTIASGQTAHAEGSATYALGYNSHTEGGYTLTGKKTDFINSSTVTTSIGGSSKLTFPFLGNSTLDYTPGSYITVVDNNLEYVAEDTVYSSSYDGSYTTIYFTTLPTSSYVGYILSSNGTYYYGSNAHAEGYRTVAYGVFSHAEGIDTIASGLYSHAEGSNTSAIGDTSHAEGSSTIASGAYSHAEGDSTAAIGYASHAEGVGTVASGAYSHAAGFYTVASGSAQFVIGQYNLTSSATSAFIIGNGLGSSNRSNLLFASGSQVQITGSLNVTQGIIGSLQGTASWASNALTSSYVNTLKQNVTVIPPAGASNIGLIVSGSGTKGGTGYLDFLQVTNTSASIANPNKYFRLSTAGDIEVLRSDYNALILSLTNGGILSVGGGNTAATSNNDPTTNYLSFGSNNTTIYDDGNTHIHSRGSGQSMWINTNGGQLNLITQTPVNGGASGSGVSIGGGGTLTGYVTINHGKSYTTAANYGYLTTAGAGTYPGGSQTVSLSLYATSRIWGQEIDAFSDERMKDIQGEITLEDGLKLVKELKPVKYTWKEGDDKGLKVGYSAQQVSKAGFDHLISLIPKEGLEETIDDDGFVSPKDTQFSMNYDQVTPYHGVVLKHLLEKIEQLEQEIKQLKASR